ncbi:MAG: Ig-like domain-containing protein, partial [Solirubrobacteraceae bacterium]
LIVVAGFRVPLMPYAPSDYSPTWVEWSILGGAFGLFALIISVFTKLFPVISIWEVVEHRGPEPTAPGPMPPTFALPRVARILPLLVLLGSAAGLALGGQAQADSREATRIATAIPPQAGLGQLIQAQARLVDSSGAPIAKATVTFATPLSFLEGTSDVVLAEAVTDAGGVATAEFELRTSGALTIHAAFKGDTRYAPSTVSAPITITGDTQLYVQRAGVRIPGINAPPPAVPAAASLWPEMSGWPIALVLIVVWSLYAFVALLVARIARADEVL